MTALSHPYSFTAGTTITASEVNSNFTATRSIVNGQLADDNFASTASLYSVYRSAMRAGAPIVAGTTAATYGFKEEGGTLASGTNGTTIRLLYFDDADFTASGRTQKLRVRAQTMVNATAPAITFTVGLHEVTAVAGGAGGVTYTLGAAVTGSTVAFATPAGSSRNQSTSGDFTIPADGYYCLGVVLSGTVAANSAVSVHAELQNRWI